MSMHSYSLLQVIGPDGYCKNYANGRRISATRYDLIRCHARMSGSQDCFTTTRKGDRWHHRQECRTRFKI